MNVIANDSNRDWHAWGKSNPYFGVLSDPKYLNANLNDRSLEEFFESGERHVEHVYDVIRTFVRPGFQADRVLDYGCGVGRLVIPFAQRSSTVLGVDISNAMLQEARENCKRCGSSSSKLLHVDELSSLPLASFDLVHSYIVFQHIPVARGESILRELLSLLAPGGVAAIHLTYSDSHSTMRRIARQVRQRVNLAHKLMNILQHRPASTPLMQMNIYSLRVVFDMLTDTNCSNMHVEFTNHFGFHGAMLYFEKPWAAKGEK